MAGSAGPITEAELRSTPELADVLRRHAYRGLRLQLLMRAVLVVFVTLTVVLVPPVQDAVGCVVVIVAYAVASAGIGWWIWRGGRAPVRFGWLALFVDLAALTALILFAGVSAEQSWTADLLNNGFFLVPLLAAAQLRPWVSAAVMVPTFVVYLGSAIATRTANGEPWGSVLLRTLVLAGAGVACVLLSRVQRSRVFTIAGMARDRSRLTHELVTLEERERRQLSEELHDGALQYVLAARMDLEDLEHGADRAAYERLDRALTESAGLLRSTVTELHPAVLAEAGLPRAVTELVRTAAERGRLRVEIDVAGWPDDVRAVADPVLYAAARELIGNVVRHANARSLTLRLELTDHEAMLEVSDDGDGTDPAVLRKRLAEGHIGLASQRIRVEAAGGTLTIRPRDPAGTTAEVRVPFV